jgi:PIN domain nuclease of toxin-antitoxin system
VWLDGVSPRLGGKANEQIDAAFQSGHTAVSAISFWEVGTLIRKGRIRLKMDLLAWRESFLRQGVQEFPVTGDIGILASGFQGFHGDLADRLIAATALHHSATLITADPRILSSEFSVRILDARS